MQKCYYIILFIILALSNISCSIEKNHSMSDITEYIYSDGHKSYYVVDTIKIDSPIIVLTKSNHIFTMSQKVFDNYNGKIDYFFNHSEVYLIEDFHPIETPQIYPPRLKSCLDFLKPIKVDKNNIYKYSENPDYFILCLVNGDFFNSYCVGFDGYSTLNLKNLRFSYYKMVIPACSL